MKQFNAMVYARTMEFVRDRGTLFWTLLFPVILVLGFSFAFSSQGNSLFKVGVFGQPDSSLPFMGIEQADFIRYDGAKQGQTLAGALDRLRRHELDLVIDFGAKAWWLNEKGRNASLIRRLFATEASAAGLAEKSVSGEAIRYVDWFVPGVIGMNMLFSCLFGVGFVIVRYRKNGVLKRLKATPVSAFAFLSAQALSRFAIVLASSVVVFAGTNAFLHFMMKGSWADLLLLTSLGIVSMISLGLVFAARFRSEELANGLLNLLTFPMLGLSGVFFSLEGSPPVLRSVASIFPLTHVTQAARSIMLEGSGLLRIAPDLAYLGLFSLGALALSALLFKWE